MKTYQIHLLRHGITDGNLNGQYIGSTDLPLCDEGKKQLRELDEHMVYPAAAAYITSPMLRCRQSLELLYPAAKPLTIEDLRECDFGEFEGHTAAELATNDTFSQWIAGAPDSAPFGGEPMEHFAQRVCAAFESIVNGLLKTGTTSCVIMTHGGVVSLLMSKYGLPHADPVDWPCQPCCGYSIRIHPQLWMSGQVFEVCERLPLPRRDEDDAEDTDE